MGSRDPQTPGRRRFPTKRQRRPLRVFLSYRREDASGHAGRLYDLLAARYGTERVFMDIDAIPLGSEFAETINRAVASCDVLIALIGRDWLEAKDADGHRRLDDPDDFVRREIESALGQGVVVVPATVQGAELPRARAASFFDCRTYAATGIPAQRHGLAGRRSALDSAIRGGSGRAGRSRRAGAPPGTVTTTAPHPSNLHRSPASFVALVAAIVGVLVVRRRRRRQGGRKGRPRRWTPNRPASRYPGNGHAR